MRRIKFIEHVETWEKGGKTHYRTHAILDDGTECVGYGKDFKVGDKVVVFYHDQWDTVKMKLHNSVREKHGLRHTPEYEVWAAAKARVFNPNNKQYSDYGGRGISMSSEWASSFLSFFEYMGKRPKGKWTLERIDNNGNYEPGNVKWATSLENNRNRRVRKNAKDLKYVEKRGNRYIVSAYHSETRGLVYIGTFYDETEAAQASYTVCLQFNGVEL